MLVKWEEECLIHGYRVNFYTGQMKFDLPITHPKPINLPTHKAYKPHKAWQSADLFSRAYRGTQLEEHSDKFALAFIKFFVDRYVIPTSLFLIVSTTGTMLH